jgi:membrane protein insertase Oxa1/YidC/SpoIIIJ
MDIATAFVNLLDALGNNIVWVIIFIAIVILSIIAAIIIRSITQIKVSKINIKIAQLTNETKKLEMVAKRALIEDLKNASVILNDNERKHLDQIQVDNAILSRKMIFLMNEAGERTKRLELGTDAGMLINTITKIRNQESKLFKSDLG